MFLCSMQFRVINMTISILLDSHQLFLVVLLLLLHDSIVHEIFLRSNFLLILILIKVIYELLLINIVFYKKWFRLRIWNSWRHLGALWLLFIWSQLERANLLPVWHLVLLDRLLADRASVMWWRLLGWWLRCLNNHLAILHGRFSLLLL